MKRIFIAVFLMLLSFTSISQTCEVREKQLLTTIGSFSAAMLYNTYGLIGSISDGFANDVYDSRTTTDLLDAQDRLMDNLIEVFEDLNKGKYLKDTSDAAYANSAIGIMKGLKKQSQLMKEYVKSKSNSKRDAYEAQRARNWKELSALMGLEEN